MAPSTTRRAADPLARAARPRSHTQLGEARPGLSASALASALAAGDSGAASALPISVLAELGSQAGNTALSTLVAQRAAAPDAPVAASGATAARAAGAAAPTRPVLREGDGPRLEVGELQQALNALGAASPPLRITTVFDAATATAVLVFQATHPPLRADGVADAETWALIDRLAPRVVRHGRSVVEEPGGGDARGVPDRGTTHPTLRRGSRGPAVEELQQKLNTLPGDQVPSLLGEDGKFGAQTQRAVRDFQRSRTPPLPADGIVGPRTWEALDAVAGAVSVGREDFEWSQRAEGTITGGPTRFTWRLLPDRLQATVNIRFTGAPSHPRVAQWRTDITSVWNQFRFENANDRARPVDLEFVVGTGTPADATVAVVVTPPGATPGRSDAANWHTGDTDPGLAPHEFGHLIGLRDEYNQGPEQYAALTGEQAPIGQLAAPLDGSGNPVDPATIAAEMRTAVTTGAEAGRGAAARAVVAKYHLRQGAFSQRVAVAYETAYAGSLLREDWGSHGYTVASDAAGTMANDIAARIPGRFDAAGNEAAAVAPFLYDNRSIMGSMESLNSPVNAHDHPVAERHVRHFLEILRRNRPGTWRTVRR